MSHPSKVSASYSPVPLATARGLNRRGEADVHRSKPRRNRSGYNGQIGKIRCLRCGRPNTVVMSDYTLMWHKDIRGGTVTSPSPVAGGRSITSPAYCRGPADPDAVFSELLEVHSLRVAERGA